MVKGEKQLLEIVLCPPHAATCVHSYTHAHKINVAKKKKPKIPKKKKIQDLAKQLGMHTALIPALRRLQ